MRCHTAIIIFFLQFTACSINHSSFTYQGRIESGTWIRDFMVPYTYNGKSGTVPAQIYFPNSYEKGRPSRTCIVLPGYRFSMREWEKNSQVCDYADRFCIVLVCPEMTTTLYESRYYPETSNKWAAIPGGVFIGEALVPWLKTVLNLAVSRKLTGIFGLSTGGKGAVLMAAKYPEIFGAAASLSGDFDPLAQKNDPLLKSIFGPYEKNPKRWAEDDNIMLLAPALKKTPVFLSHGKMDPVVPHGQTEGFVKRLTELKKELGGFEMVYHTKKSPNASHDWDYWKSMVPDMMEFFDNVLGR
jgi:dienelactone hydrolase